MSIPGPRVLSLARYAVACMALAALAVVPMRLQGQEAEAEQCRFLEGTESAVTNVLPGAGRISWVSRPRIACSDGVRIEADSAVAYSAQSMSHLMGNVRYHDGSRELRADEARYFSNVGRLQASGHLFLRDTLQGSTIENGDLVYLRETDFRPQEEMTVTIGRDRIRPKAFLRVGPARDTATEVGAVRPADTLRGPPVAEPDSAMVPDTVAAAADTVPAAADTLPAALEPEAAPPSPRPAPAPRDTVPYEVEANRIFLKGDQYFTASGDVVIERDSLLAYGDSAEYDQVDARMDLVGSARVDGSDYDLSGRRIELSMPGGEMRSVRALHEAQLVGEDLHMRAPSIQIVLADGEMQRLVAVSLPPPEASPGVPPPEPDSLDLARPVAVAEDFELTADSVDVSTPGQVLDRIFAAGDARGQSTARDSLNVPSLPPVARRDWLEGDTVVATFVRAAPQPGQAPDSARQTYQLDSLVAHGTARSLYRLLPSDSTARPGIDPPAVSYVTGSKITIVMNDGEVDRMEVEGPTEGWHLEPTTRGTPRDSLASPDSLVSPDSLAPPDTSDVRPDTAAVSPLRAVAGSVVHGRSRAPGHGADAAEPEHPALPSTDRMPRRRRRTR